jgi:ribosome-binding protein aMBF1 (putative translation factor)
MVNQNSAEQFEKAGAQAAEVLGRFVQFATDLSREFDTGRNSQNPSASDNPQSAANEADDILRDVGERLRELRETAGYTIDGFATALESVLENQRQHAEPVKETIDAVETGRKAPPDEWAQAFSSLLGSNEVKNLFEQLGVSSKATTAETSQVPSRADRLSAVFADDHTLNDLSEAEFEKLVDFMNASYRQARAMISD